MSLLLADTVVKRFCAPKRAILIQDQAPMRNVDSKNGSCRFDCCAEGAPRRLLQQNLPKPDASRCGIQSKGARYSITSLARASSVGGTLRPRARAVGRFIASTNLADCTTGKSAGFSPLMIRPA